jgi:DNA polymerase
MPGERISRAHGTTRRLDPGSGARAATGYAMYHPAAALRQGALKETMQRDMAKVPEVLIRSRAERAAIPAGGPDPGPVTEVAGSSEARPPSETDDQYGFF